MVPLGIGLLGLVIGVIALFMSFSNSSAVKDLATLKDTVSAAASKADDAKTAADGLSGKVDANTNNLTALRSNVQEYLTKVGDAINQQGKDIETLKSQVSSRSTSSSTRGGGSTGGTSNVVAGQGGDYVVASGDNFYVIARKYGVSVAEIEAANPGVDPSKLRPGQHLTIPPAKGASSRSAPRSSTSTSTAPDTSSTPAPAVTSP